LARDLEQEPTAPEKQNQRPDIHIEYSAFEVVPPGIEPGTQGFSVIN